MFLYQSIVLQLKEDILIKWWIVCDGKEYNFWSTFNRVDLMECPHFEINVAYFDTWGNGVVGHDQRNYALKYLPIGENEYVYHLDDDNILHPDFLKIISSHMNGSIIVGDQILKDGQIRLKAAPEHVVPGRIDTAQFLMPYVVARQATFPLLYDGDGHYIFAIFKYFSHNFECINKPICYYNFLR